MARKDLGVIRGIRADQYGIRTWLGPEGEPLKLEVVRESRIELAGSRVAGVPVAALDRACAFAEKLLANADRGLDRSTLSRDVVDLAFMVQAWGLEPARAGAALAREAYGGEVDRKLAAVVELLRADRAYRARCVEALAIDDAKTLAKGLERLSRWR